MIPLFELFFVLYSRMPFEEQRVKRSFLSNINQHRKTRLMYFLMEYNIAFMLVKKQLESIALVQ